MKRFAFFAALLLAGFALSGVRCSLDPASDSAPCNVYLTWQGDTSTTITVNFHTLTGDGGDPIVYYDIEPHGLDLGAYAFTAIGDSVQMPAGTDERFVHSIQLTDLEPGETYHFVATLDEFVNDDLETYSTGVRSFRTIPNDGEPIRFITGGDMDTHLATWDLMRRARERNPMFGVIGGDIAYANGERRRFGKWDAWLGMWEEIMVTEAGHMVPLVMAIGNHEVDGGYTGTADDAPFFINYFPQEAGRTYFTRMFGPDLVLFILDSGHIAPPGGAQAEWLRNAFLDHAGVPHQFAVYHVPLYPSHRDFLNFRSFLGRAAWRPLFDEFGLDTAFENHDHTLKRTKRLRGGVEDPEGTLYLGDGCFGQFTRDINDENRSYLDFAASVRHFWLVEVDGEEVAYTAIDRNGNVVDEVTTTNDGFGASINKDYEPSF